MARELAQELEDRAAAVERRAARNIPALSDAAVGDQVAVTGADLLAAARAAAPDPAVAAEVSRALEELRRVRAAL
jgi:hypothetical protein